MFARKTVVIVGAGCSHEYGLPVGNGLRNRIVALLSRLGQVPETKLDTVFAAAIRTLAEDQTSGVEDEWLSAAEEIARGVMHSSSIDRYLSLRQDNKKIVQIGKLAIVACISEAESNSSLMLNCGNIDFDSIKITTRGQPDWLSEIFLRMQEDCYRDNFSEAFSNLTFICFNYDRCIEHYFMNAVKGICSLSMSEAAKVLERLEIIHPYGRIGAPPWESGPPILSLGYGTIVNDEDRLIELSKGIRIYTENVSNDSDLEPVHRAIIEADRMVFAGFSFLDQNMDLLTPHTSSKCTEVYATAFRESHSNVEIASYLIKTMLNGRDKSGRGHQNLSMLPVATAGSLFSDFGNKLRR